MVKLVEDKKNGKMVPLVKECNYSKSNYSESNYIRPISVLLSKTKIAFSKIKSTNL